MEKKQPATLFSLIKFFTGLSLFAFLFWVCNAQDKKKEPGTGNLSQSQIKINCVRITKQQLQDWVDKGWTDPANPIKRIFLQFASTDASNPDSIKLTAYPAKGYLEVINEGMKFTSVDTVCKQYTPVDTAYFGNNYVQLKKLNILDSSGKLKDFSFIRFIPTMDKVKYGNYLVFNVEIVQEVNGKETVLNAYTSDPCPHYCPDDSE